MGTPKNGASFSKNLNPGQHENRLEAETTSNVIQTWKILWQVLFIGRLKKIIVAFISVH